VKRILVTTAVLWLAFARPASAQIYGQFTGAVPVDVNSRLFGIYGGVAKDTRELLAQLRMSFYPGVDFGFHGGFSRVKAGTRTRTAVEMGGDLRTKVATRSETFPVDIALGGAIGLQSAEGFNVLTVGPTVVASRAVTSRNGSQWTPYAGLALLYSRWDLGGITTTDASLPLRLGTELKVGPDIRLVLEAQAVASSPTDEGIKLVLGANFPF
jgi:hypothetical protein